MRMTSRFVQQSALVMGALTLMISTPGQAQAEAAKVPAPTLHSSSQGSDAPGKGILPMISGQMAAGLSLYHLDAQPIEQVSALIQRQYLHGFQSTFSWIMKKGPVYVLDPRRILARILVARKCFRFASPWGKPMLWPARGQLMARVSW